ncbi:MAG: OmpH family outer membrane protein [Deltaproteobacteria bacterium]|jgi:Skp family chaperone for outer membrane proteins|nr:OmpH family outer membrane protein [Deltaproteobacteria bacterium]
MSYRLILSLFSICFFLGLYTNHSVAEESYFFGVVDMVKAIDDSQVGKAASQKLQERYDRIQAQLDTKRQALEKKVQALNQEASSLSYESYNSKREALEKETRALQEEIEKSSAEFKKAADALYGPIYDRAESHLKRIATEKGLIAVIDGEKSSVLFAVPNTRFLNLTEEITQALDNQ